MQALSRFVLGHRLLVGLFWLVVFAAGAATADRVSGRLSQDFASPGAPSICIGDMNCGLWIAQRTGR